MTERAGGGRTYWPRIGSRVAVTFEPKGAAHHGTVREITSTDDGPEVFRVELDEVVEYARNCWASEVDREREELEGL